MVLRMTYFFHVSMGDSNVLANAFIIDYLIIRVFARNDIKMDLFYVVDVFHPNYTTD